MNHATLTGLTVVGVTGALTEPAVVLDRLFPLFFGVLEYGMGALMAATKFVMAFVALVY